MVSLIDLEFHIAPYIPAKHPRIGLFLFFHYEGLKLFVIEKQSAESVRETCGRWESFVFGAPLTNCPVLYSPTPVVALSHFRYNKN